MPLSLHALMWLSTLIDLGVATFLLSRLPGLDRHAPSAIGLGRLLLVGVLTGVVFMAKLVFLVPAGLGAFGLIHLLYLDLVVAMPVLGAIVLFRPLLFRKRSGVPRPTWTVALAAAGMLLLAPVGVYASFVEPFRLQVEHATAAVPAERQGSRTLRVGVLADIQTNHVTEHERQAVDALMAREPDLILLPGDLFQGSRAEFERELPALRELVGRLRAPGGVYFVMGDVDPPSGIERVFDGSQVRVLRNRVEQTRVGDRLVTIGGLELDVHSPAARQVIRELESDTTASDIRLLVAHRPDAALLLQPGSRVDLVVAGHTHGGQVQLPLLGPPITLTSVPRHVAAGGLHDVGQDRWIYVSRGVGWEHDQAPRIRFLCPPEVSVIEMEEAGRRQQEAGSHP